MNKLDPFEKLMKGKLDGFEVPYNASHWDEMSSILDSQKGGHFTSSKIWLIGGIVAIAAATAFVVSSNNSAEPIQSGTLSMIEEVHLPKSDLERAEIEAVTKVERFEESVSTNNEVEQKKSAEDLVETKENNSEINSVLAEEQDAVDAVKTLENEGNHDLVMSKNNSQDDKQPERLKIKPFAAFNMQVTRNCGESVVMFNVKEPIKDAEYIWNFGDGETSTERNPKHHFVNPGEYRVNLTARSNSDHSSLEKSSDQIIVVLESPEVSFDWDFVGDPMEASLVKLKGHSDNITKWTWTVSDGRTFSGPSPEVKFTRKGNYEVRLVVENENGCQGSVSNDIVIDKDYNLLAPTAFTPDGDGRNDEFMPVALTVLRTQFVMRVYDRSTLIFETSQADMKWNGISQRTGKQCLNGAYVWYVKTVNDVGDQEEYTGTVVLTR